MKNLILILTVMFGTLTISAQHQHRAGDRKGMGDKAKSLWVAYLTQELELTPDESARFWPVYNEYKEKERELNKSKHQKALKSPNEMTDAEIDMIYMQNISTDEKLLGLKKEYYPKLKATIPAKKVIRIQKIEREFKMKLIKKIQERRGQR